jgi:hypothetical protein
VIETRCRFSFTPETLKSFMRICVKAQDALETDDAARVALPCAIYHTHPTARNLLQDFIITETPFSVGNVDLSQEVFKPGSNIVAGFWGETPPEQTVDAKAVLDRGTLATFRTHNGCLAQASD